MTLLRKHKVSNMHFKKIGTGILGLHIVSLLQAGDGGLVENNETLWIALVALAIVGLLILFVSSKTIT